MGRYFIPISQSILDLKHIKEVSITVETLEIDEILSSYEINILQLFKEKTFKFSKGVPVSAR